MNLKSSILLLALALPALAGPPLICHPVEIHGAKSLPWNAHAQGWDGADKSYDASTRLIPDTLALLTPLTPVSVRMETLRRASIYAARHATLAADLDETRSPRQSAHRHRSPNLRHRLLDRIRPSGVFHLPLQHALPG